MDIKELITAIEVELDLAEKRRTQNLETIKYTLAQVNKEGRSGFSKEEQEKVDELYASVERAAPEIAEIKNKLEAARRAAEQEAKLDALSATKADTPAKRDKPSYDRVARVGSEERTYHPGYDRRGKQFLSDVVSQRMGNLEAQQRLVQHMREERVERAQYMERAVGTDAYSGLVIPQYLTELYAPRVQALRPFADVCNKHDLPATGMTVNIGRVTTGTAVGLQTSEHGPVAESNFDDTLLSESVQTAAGKQTLSRQAIERGNGVEEVTLDDLFRTYATTFDSTLINQATTGLSAVSNTVAFTSPVSAVGFYPKLHEAGAAIEAALLGHSTPSHVVMHSRRWYWLQSQLGTSWPLVGQPNIATQNIGTNNGSAYNSGVRGVLPNGMAVIVDNNIATNKGGATNEDEVYVIAADECHLWEDPNAPVFLRAEEPKAETLGVQLVIYGYFAYSFRRYTGAMQKIAGAGLVTPSFA